MPQDDQWVRLPAPAVGGGGQKGHLRIKGAPVEQESTCLVWELAKEATGCPGQMLEDFLECPFMSPKAASSFYEILKIHFWWY